MTQKNTQEKDDKKSSREPKMEIKVYHKKDLSLNKDRVFIHIITKNRLSHVLMTGKGYSENTLRTLEKARIIREFCGNVGDILIVYPDSDINIQVFVGLGEINELSPRVFQNCGALLAKRLANFQIKEAVLDLSSNSSIDPFFTVKSFLEGIAIGAYTFSKYFTKQNPFPLGMLRILIHDKVDRETAENSILDASINISASNIARHITNEAANNKTPDKLEAVIKRLFHNYGNLYRIKTLDYNELRKEKLNLLAAVGQAGSELPRLTLIEFIFDKSYPTVGIVGKAVTFDSGGLMIKSKDSLPHMSEDVGGAAALIGAMSVVHKLKLNFNVVAAIPIAENLIDSNAYRPSDIIVTKDGTSVEINNTDAEGRLMLADSFLYLQENYELIALMDIATLTGAITRALGKKIAGFFTNNQKLANLFKTAYSKSLEKFWQMPLEPEYNKNLNSHFANIKNDGGEPKAICAAMFLSYFIKNDLPWLHLDVGSCINPGSNDILYGSYDYANGIPSITIVEFLRILNSSDKDFDENH